MNIKFFLSSIIAILLFITLVAAEDIDDFCFIGPQDCQISCGYDPETGQERTVSFLVGSYISEKDSGDVADFRIGYYYNHEFQGWLIGEARGDWMGYAYPNIAPAGSWEVGGERYRYMGILPDETPFIATRTIRGIDDDDSGYIEPHDEHYLARVDFTLGTPFTTYTSQIFSEIDQGLLRVFRTYGLSPVCGNVNVALFAETWNYNGDTYNDGNRPGYNNAVRCKCDITGASGLATATQEKTKFWHLDTPPACRPNNGRSQCNNGAHSNTNDYCMLTSILPTDWQERSSITYEDMRIDEFSSNDDGCGLTSDSGYQESLGVS